jgi:hypothetical protein
MRVLKDDELNEIERLMARRLTKEELDQVSSVDAIPPAAVEVARVVAKQSRPLALKYLRELVPDARLSIAMLRLEAIIEARA